MKNQIIKKHVDFFNSFIQTHCVKENDYYISNYLVFKKLIFENQMEIFLHKLHDYYYQNKHYYLKRDPISYNQYNTILRQICKVNEVKLEPIIRYTASKYDAEYHIYIDS